MKVNFGKMLEKKPIVTLCKTRVNALETSNCVMNGHHYR